MSSFDWGSAAVALVSAVDVNKYTSSPVDSAQAAAYSAWVHSITGTYPLIVDLGSGRAKVTHTPEQIAKLQDWLDSQVGGLLARQDGDPPTVEYDLGQVLTPWAFKYLFPIGAGLFIGGWIAHYLLSR